MKRTPEQQALCNAICDMPFGGGLQESYTITGGDYSLEAITTYLEGLALRLRGHVEKTDPRLKELADLKRDVAAFRRVMHGAE